MNLAALAILRDLARSRSLLKKGKGKRFLSRKLKIPAKGGPKSKVLVRMNGLGHADPRMVVSEADAACKLLMKAEVKSMNPLQWMSAIEDYFRASAIATNVLFTSKVEKLKLPANVTRDMETVVSKSMDAIKRMARSAVLKAVFKRMGRGTKQ